MSNRLADHAFITMQYLLPHHGLSRLVGKLAASKNTWVKSTFIKYFAKKFDIDMSEALHPDLDSYESFNDFFTRALIEGARPIDSDSASIVSPADGAISECGDIVDGRVMQAKGHSYSLHTLLGGKEELTEEFEGGKFATVYLSPRDYHRVHMPTEGVLRKMIYVPGKLFSVNDTTAQHVPELFARNERLVCIFDTPKGPMALVLVGAMIVAAIETVWSGQVCPLGEGILSHDYDENGQSPAVKLAKGDEMGRFKLGSTAIMVFPKGSNEWIDELEHGHVVRMGEKIGSYT